MKKIIRIVLLLVATTTLMVSCIEDFPVYFDETLLIGKWQSGTVFYKYVSDGSGTTWDTSDDVTEAEAQGFTWTLVNSELTHIYVLEIGGSVPKVYTVTELTETTLIYKDDFGTIYSFMKVAI